MNTAVIYKSKYGTTKKYAEWLAGELNCPLFERSKITSTELSQFDLVIYGGGLYAGGIDGVNLIVKNPCKHLVVFTVGLSNPETTDYTEIINKNIPQDLQSRAKVFHLRGGMDYKKLKIHHRGMMAMVKNFIIGKKPPEELREDEKGILETYGKAVDFTDKTSIKPIVEYVRGL